MIVGERLRALRKERGITAEELSNVLGMSKQQVLRYEANKTDITSSVLIKIADFFDVSTDYLLGRADKPSALEYRSSPLVWNVDTTKLLQTFPPEFVARVVKAFGLEVRLKNGQDDPNS